MTEQSIREHVRVPFVDLGPSHEALREGILEGIGDLLDSGAFTNGRHVGDFESAFAEYCGAARCVGLASGLDALRLGLTALGVGQGDEVIVPAATFIATFEAVSQVGARPVPVDVGEDDYNLDPRLVRAALTDKTRAIVPVDLYGQLADMRRLRDIAEPSGVAVLEDACQAHGAARDGAAAGRHARAAAFSFYPAKNLGAFGDAGAFVTDDERLADEVLALREHGQSEKYRHRLIGFTSRLDTIQALVLAVKLPLLDEWNEERRAAASYYSSELEGTGDLRLPPVPDGSDPAWHLYVVRTEDPEGLASHLRESQIGTGRHYPEPPHLSAAYRDLGYENGAFPVAEALSAQALSLPLYPGITEQQLEAVVARIRAYFTGA